jgi:predicted nucleotidyltransferase
LAKRENVEIREQTNMKTNIASETALNETTELQSVTNPILNRYAGFLKAVAVFGSFARGIAKFPGSDIDFLIVLRASKQFSLIMVR